MPHLEPDIAVERPACVSRCQWLCRQFSGTVWRAASIADPVTSRWRSLLSVAILVGIMPVAIGFSLANSWHQPATALIIAPLVWSCARRDAWQKGMALLAVTFVCHSIAIIAGSYWWPATAPLVVPDGQSYWGKQWTWITTGSDPEYELANWTFAHLQLLLGTTIFSFTSLGVITIHQGVYEVDLMNFYNAMLLHYSRSGWWSLLLGWHVWSMLRGIGYVVLTYEMISLSLQVFSGRRISTGSHRGLRWAIACTCLLGDATTKYLFLEAVRMRLFDNLLGS